ncbi:Inorganic polyphosphate/ATP-NAD kinase [Candidatus Bealeia paramacronuclearis]|uniref:NAD kinase n=1 Tax=Candidatus Bealeia paramacronuclearis TaxID=1921001 RepID=A0ABZ2C2U9_9PROT|nr:Inorganic polyphosphate/ATP-NAD kinase [Candidatus Bealeia paramacronuclearis]
MKKFAFIGSDSPEAKTALEVLSKINPQHTVEDADVIIALGGDGLMLEVLHKTLSISKPVYGMNCGTVGFLMNSFSEDALQDRVKKAIPTHLHPLKMSARTNAGEIHRALAFNEVSLIRESRQASKIEISIDGRVRLTELICDGVLISTPAGSTAYNLSAHGPILPIGSPLLALTPISAYRPRRWHGAILPHSANITFTILDREKRPVTAVADFTEIRDVISVSIHEDRTHYVTVLFDEGHNLEERILQEQFHVG